MSKWFNPIYIVVMLSFFFVQFQFDRVAYPLIKNSAEGPPTGGIFFFVSICLFIALLALLTHLLVNFIGKKRGLILSRFSYLFLTLNLLNPFILFGLLTF